MSSGVVAKVLVGAGVAVALFGMAAAITLIALEGEDVVVLRTFGPDGEARDARVWIVEDPAGAWVEVASRDDELHRRIVAHPRVEVVRRNGETARYLARPDASPDARARVRRLLSQKYGWADDWIGVLVDTSDSVAVRLVPAGSAEAATVNSRGDASAPPSTPPRAP